MTDEQELFPWDGAYPESTDKVFVVVYDITTGKIKSRIKTSLQDAHRQHHPGHDYIDVTREPEIIHPLSHVIDLKTLRPVARVLSLEEAVSFKLLDLDQKFRAEIHTHVLSADDFITSRNASRVKFESLKARVKSCRTVEAVAAVQW